MQKNASRLITAGIMLSTAMIVTAAVTTTYTEDFSTTLRRDPTSTTAWWDTDGGRAHLHPFSPAEVGQVSTAGQAFNVAISGQHVFLADNNGLKVVDVADRSNPALVGSVSTPGTTRHVAVAGHHAYVADSASGLTVVNVGDPTTPAVVGTVDTPGNARAVVVAGNLAYVADDAGGLQIADITDPATPSLVGNLGFAGQALDLAVSGDLVYVAAGAAGMHVVDVSDPTSPWVLVTMPTSASAAGIDISGDLVYVAGSAAGLYVMDVSSPGSVALRTTVPLAGSATDVAVLGGFAYVALGEDGVAVVDVSAYTGMTVLATLAGAPDWALGVAADGNHVFAAVNGAGLWIAEVATAVEIQNLDYFPDFITHTTHALDGDYLATGGSSNVGIYDVSQPTSPVELAQIAVYTNRLILDGNRLYVTSSSEFGIFDLTDPVNPTIQSAINLGSSVSALAAAGGHVYVASSGTVHVIDVSDPTTPVAVGSTPADGLNVLVAKGDIVYAVGHSCCLPGDFSIIDVSDPSAPTTVGTYALPSGWEATGLDVSGAYAYVAVDETGDQDTLYVFDVSDPTNPVPVTSLTLNARTVTVHGDLLYVGGRGIIHVLDITDPAAPELEASYEMEDPNPLEKITIHGDIAFAGWFRSPVGSTDLLQLASRYFKGGNVIQSTPLIASGDLATQVRLTSVQGGAVQWSVDGPVGWQSVAASGSWSEIYPSDLTWRAILVEDQMESPGVSPFVDSFDMEWRFPAAVIDSIADVPDDQGGWARVHFTRSANDYQWSSAFAEEYVLLRRMTLSAKTAGGIANPDAHTEAAAMAATLPPGTWEIVTSFSPMFQENYVVLAPTLADSTAGSAPYTVFTVATKVGTGGSAVFHYSLPDSVCSVDNIAPGVPQGMAVAYNTGSGNELDWDAAPEPDFQYHRIYRAVDPGFTPDPGNLIHETAAAGWTDPVAGGFEYHYKVTTVDHAGNESAPASPANVSGTRDNDVPARTELVGAMPNPFNPTTRLSFVLATPGRVRLGVYDMAGRLITTLLDEHGEVGRHHVNWYGRDDSGQTVASGVYFYRLDAADYSATKKLMLLK